MTNEERRNIVDQAKAQGYQGSYVDLFRQAAAHGGADPMFAALSNQDRAEGLAPYHEAGMHNAGMTFPDVGPNEPMNTMRTRVPIDIKKYDDKTGHLVASHLNIPPGLTNVDSGPRRGTVLETPSRRQKGGPKEDYNMARAKELGYKPDSTGHMPSVDHETGNWLKSKKHPTAWKEHLHSQLSLDPFFKENKTVVNPEGYFGNDQLQYVPRKKQQRGGYNPGEYMNEMQPKVFPNQKRDAKWVKYTTDHDFAGRFPGETKSNRELGLEISNRNTVPLPPNPIGAKEIKRAQEGTFASDNTSVSIPLPPEVFLNPLLPHEQPNQTSIGPQPDISKKEQEGLDKMFEADQKRREQIAKGVNPNTAFMTPQGLGADNEARAAYEYDNPATSSIGQIAGSMALLGVPQSLPTVGRGVIAANRGVAAGGARLAQGVNTAASAVGRSQVGQVGSRLLANTELGQGVRAFGEGLKYVSDKVAAGGKAVNNYLLGTRAGSTISSAYNAPMNMFSGASVADGVKLAVTIQGVQQVPKVPGYLASGQIGKAASTLLKVPGLKAAPAMAQLKNIKTISDASAGASAVADLGSAEDAGDIAAVTKMLPGTSGIRTIASGVDAVRRQEGGPKAQQKTQELYESLPTWEDMGGWEGVWEHGLDFFPFPGATARERISENIKPLGYGEDPGERLISGVWENNPERYSTADMDQREEEREPYMQERSDFLKLAMGQEQRYNSVPESQYRPGKESMYDWVTGQKYYASPTTEKWIQSRIKRLGPEGFIKMIEKNRDPETNVSTNYWTNTHGDNTLGNYILDVGEDENGRYISYYDKWDLNPFSGSKDNMLAKFAENAFQSVLGIEPPEVYGRIYLDSPKEKK